MSQEDFKNRMERLGVRPDTVTHSGGRSVPAAAGLKRAGPEHFLLGVLWGTALGFLAVYLNQNYDTLFHGESTTPPWALAAVGFVLVSLAVLAVMFVSGVLYALVGRIGSRRWIVILTTVVFVGAGAYLARALMVADF